jgi:hypothetical protein
MELRFFDRRKDAGSFIIFSLILRYRGEFMPCIGLQLWILKPSFYNCTRGRIGLALYWGNKVRESFFGPKHPIATGAAAARC